MRQTVELRDAQSGYQALLDLWHLAKPLLLAGKRLILSIRTDTRTLAQNRLMWSALGDLAEQVEWDGSRFDAEGWKALITGTIHGQQVVRNLECNGLVSLSRGRPTSDMTIAEMGEVIDYAHAFGDARGVKWRPTSLGREWEAGTTKRRQPQEAEA